VSLRLLRPWLHRGYTGPAGYRLPGSGQDAHREPQV